MNEKTCVVVGGGVVGLLAAYLASKNFKRVLLLEKAESLGGLLGSFERNGVNYDYGTHFPALTNIEELDTILYGNKQEREGDFHLLPYLKSENYFLNCWNPTSPLLDTRSLPENEYAQGVVELLEAPGAPASEVNLFKYLTLTFGKTFTENVFRPVIKKLLATDLEDLHRNILATFGLQRLIALSPEVTKELKNIPKYNNSLGYHSYTDGAPGQPYCYPKGEGGIGSWPAAMLNKVKAAGVEVLTGTSVDKINVLDGVATSLSLNTGENVACDHIVWTIPPAMALRAANVKLESKPPQFRTHTLCHFEFEKPFLKNFPQYLLCWDTSKLSYRVTLYPNISEDRKNSKRNNLTVEVISDVAAANRTQEIAGTVLDELKEMAIVDESNVVVDAHSEYLGSSFPILTTGFIEDAERIQTIVNDKFENVTLLGRGAGAKFAISDLLIEAYQKVKSIGS